MSLASRGSSKDLSLKNALSVDRFRTLCFWLYAEPSRLGPRLDSRVDEMIRVWTVFFGSRETEVLVRKDFWMKYAPCAPWLKLLARTVPPMRRHMLTLHWAFTSLLVSYCRLPSDELFQCPLGYKEFDAYLTSPTDLLFREAVDLMKLSTRQYAKKQISWMRNKLLPAVLQANAKEFTTPLYLLDATGV